MKADTLKGCEKRKVEAIQITLRAARVNLGLTRKQASVLFGIHHETLTKYEYDSTNCPRSFFVRLESAYGIPIENLYFGKEEEFYQKRRKRLELKHA